MVLKSGHLNTTRVSRASEFLLEQYFMPYDTAPVPSLAQVIRGRRGVLENDSLTIVNCRLTNVNCLGPVGAHY